MADTSEVRFPDVEVELIGQNGNAFLIIGKVRRALKSAGEDEAADAFVDEATSGDYDHLLRTVHSYVTII